MRQKSNFPQFKVQTLTSGPKHHFLGYYGMSPWNKSQRYMICLESDFHDHLPTVDEPAAVGLVYVETGCFKKVSETRAWNLQQGAMLHWNPLNPETEVVFNDRKGEELVSAVVNVETGEKRFLPRPISAVSHHSKFALSLTYGRLTRLRKVVGYQGTVDPNPDDAYPDNDGVFLIDLETGETKLIVSIAEVYRLAIKNYSALEGRHMWFNHTVLNKSDKRLLFLARFRNQEDRLDTAMYTVNIDGSELRQATPWGGMVSHFDWRNDCEIISTFMLGDDKTKTHYLFTDGKDNYQKVGEGFIVGDGHCTFSPDQNWLASDGSAAFGIKGKYKVNSLEIYNVADNYGVLLAMFNMRENKNLSGDLRCDLHPRWNRTSDAICVDALDTTDWTRQLHIVHLK
ncbi:hypothetical protein H8E77_20490 [bacterium]|nr:hypothetical protein [bacterium]